MLPHQARTVAFLTYALGLTIAPTAARAASAGSGLRLAAVFKETVDGTPRGASAAEAELVRELLQADKGFTFVDEAQSRKIRSVADAGKLVEGGVPDVITTLDADVLVVGVVTVVKISSAILGQKVQRMDASIHARVLSIDTASVLASIDTRGEGVGYSVEQAADSAAKKAAEGIVKELVAKLEAKHHTRRLEISVTGFPDVTHAERSLSKLEKLNGVARAKMIHAERGISKIEVETSNLTSRQLAVALDSQDVGLRVTGYSEQAIKAEYDVGRGAKLTLFLGPVKQVGAEKRNAWESRAIPEILATTLAGSGLVGIKAGAGSVELGADARAWKTALEKVEVPVDRTIVLLGSYKASGKSAIDIEAKLVAAESGALVSSAHKACPSAELGTCVGQLGASLSADLKRQLENRRDLFRLGDGAVGAPSSGEGTPLVITKLELGNIFPAQMATYADASLGTLTVKNTSNRPLKEASLTVSLPGFAKAPVTTQIGEIAAKSEQAIPVKVVLDRDALVHHDENRPAVLTAEVEYADGAYRVRAARNAGLVVYARNALSWKTPDSVGSFVTPRADEVVHLARAFHAAIPKSGEGHPLAGPVALFRGIQTLGLKYVADPLSPFGADSLDYVQFPTETLTSKSGDCDDLAVLYAALGQSIGIPVLLVMTPGHVFVAAATGVPKQSAYLVSSAPGELLSFDGQLWVPIETTKLDGTFSDAWAAATKEIAKWRSSKDKMTLLDLRSAWKHFPPSDLKPTIAEITPEDPAKLSAALERELTELDTKRKQGFETELAGIEAKIKKVAAAKRDDLLVEKAVVLAEMGRDAEAKTLLEEIVQRSKTNMVALNNLGNISMINQNVKEAHTLYRDALAHEAKRKAIEVHLNAALAALVLGNEDEFADQIVICLEAGGEEAVMSLAQSGFGPNDSSRGAAEGQLVVRDLEVALGKAFAKAKKPLPGRLREKDESRAASAAAAQPVARYLYWISTSPRH
jgi:hypothetical protein